MTDPTRDIPPRAEPALPEDLSDAGLLRAAADGELAPDVAPALRARLETLRAADPAADARIGHERVLREAVGRALAEPATAPAGLQDRLVRAFADEPLVGPAPESSDDLSIAPETVGSPLGDTRSRTFWAGAGSWLAVAAVLALAVGVIFSANRAGGPAPTAEAGIIPANLRTFVEEEHEQTCVKVPHPGAGTFEATTATGLAELSRATFAVAAGGAALPPALAQGVDRLERSGFRFVGASSCSGPDGSGSVHALFESDDRPPVLVSLFTLRSPAGMKICEKMCYTDSCDNDGKPEIVAWRVGTFHHLLYSDDRPAIETARVALGAPAAVAR